MSGVNSSRKYFIIGERGAHLGKQRPASALIGVERQFFFERRLRPEYRKTRAPGREKEDRIAAERAESEPLPQKFDRFRDLLSVAVDGLLPEHNEFPRFVDTRVLHPVIAEDLDREITHLT